MKMTEQQLLEYAAQVHGAEHIDEWIHDIKSGAITTKEQVDEWTPR